MSHGFESSLFVFDFIVLRSRFGEINQFIGVAYIDCRFLKNLFTMAVGKTTFLIFLEILKAYHGYPLKRIGMKQKLEGDKRHVW